MTNEAKRAAIQKMIVRHTAASTATKETARASLIKEGVYTSTGKLSPDFGGKKPSSR